MTETERSNPGIRRPANGQPRRPEATVRKGTPPLLREPILRVGILHRSADHREQRLRPNARPLRKGGTPRAAELGGAVDPVPRLSVSGRP